MADSIASARSFDLYDGVRLNDGDAHDSTTTQSIDDYDERDYGGSDDDPNAYDYEEQYDYDDRDDAHHSDYAEYLQTSQIIEAVFESELVQHAEYVDCAQQAEEAQFDEIAKYAEEAVSSIVSSSILPPELYPVTLDRKQLKPPSMGSHGMRVDQNASDLGNAGEGQWAIIDRFGVVTPIVNRPPAPINRLLVNRPSPSIAINRSSTVSTTTNRSPPPIESIRPPSNHSTTRASSSSSQSNKRRAADTIKPQIRLESVKIVYPGWNQAFYIKKLNPREMELKHGPLQRTRRPWLAEYDPSAYGNPWTSGTFKGTALIHLYHPPYIYHHLPEERECEMHYIDLFFQNRFFSSKSRPSDSKSPKLMLQAWINFVKEFVANPLGYPKKIMAEREKFYANTSEGIAMDIHRLSISAGLNCTVPKMYKCLSCYSDSPRCEFVEVSNDPSATIRLHQIHNKLINRFNFSMIKKSDDTKAEMVRFERVAIKLQMENAELLTSTRQNDNELQTLRNWRSDLTRETVTLQSQLQIAMNEIEDLRNRVASQDTN